jgi:hypothetical protein
MKTFLIALALVLAGAIFVPPTSAGGVPHLVAPSSMVEKIKRNKNKCYNDCVVKSGCEGDIFGQCLPYCKCVCNATTPKQAKKCPLPS